MKNKSPGDWRVLLYVYAWTLALSIHLISLGKSSSGTKGDETGGENGVALVEGGEGRRLRGRLWLSKDEFSDSQRRKEGMNRPTADAEAAAALAEAAPDLEAEAEADLEAETEAEEAVAEQDLVEAVMLNRPDWAAMAVKRRRTGSTSEKCRRYKRGNALLKLFSSRRKLEKRCKTGCQAGDARVKESS